MAEPFVTNGAGASRGPSLVTGPSVYGAIRCLDAPQVHRNIGAIGADAPLYDAVNLMWWRQRGTVAVTEDEAVIGSVSEDDLLRVAQRALHLHDESLEAAAEAKGPNLQIWDELLRDLRVRDAMSALDDMAVVGKDASLLEGVRQTLREKRSGARRRYIFVLDADQRLCRVVSMRDVCRYLIAIYDGGPEAEALPVAGGSQLGRAAREVLDLPVGMIRTHRNLGHEAIAASIDDHGAASLEKMWQGRRGYVLVSFFDGAPQGICTRRDVLRVLRRPYARLRDLAVAHLMSAEVKAASRLITLGGVFKLMAIGGYRHLPLLEADGGVECVISMWEGVTLFSETE